MDPWLLLVLVPVVAVLYYWLIGAPLQGKGSPYGRVGVIPRRIADSLTSFDEKPVGPPSPEEMAKYAHGSGVAVEPMPLDPKWAELVRLMSARIEIALGDGIAAESNDHGLVLHHGATVRSVPLAHVFEPPPVEENDRAVRGCLVMLEEAQAFRANELNERWPVRTAIDGGPRSTSQVVPRAIYRNGTIHPGYHDDAGSVLELDPVAWPPVR